MEYINLFLWSLPTGFWYSSRAEWIIHFFFMHRITWGIKRGFEKHHKVHHVEFRHDETFESDDPKKMKLIPMGKMDGPLLVFLTSLPVWAILGILCFWLPFLWPIGAAISFMLTVHFIWYESFHYVMHMKADHWLKHWWIYKVLCAHHHLHHAHMGMNLNVSNRLADLLSGTLIVPTENGYKRVLLPRFLRVNVIHWLLNMCKFYVLRYQSF